MLMTHLAASQYRYYRWLLAGAVGVAILLVSLYTRYYQEVKSIEQSQQTLATRTVGKIDQLLSPRSCRRNAVWTCWNNPARTSHRPCAFAPRKIRRCAPCCW